MSLELRFTFLFSHLVNLKKRKNVWIRPSQRFLWERESVIGSSFGGVGCCGGSKGKKLTRGNCAAPTHKNTWERERERDMVGVPYIMLSPSPQDVPRSRFVTARKKQSCHCEQVGQWTPTCWENTNQSLTQEEQGWPRKYKCWTMSRHFACDVWLREMRFKIQIVYLRPVSSYTGTHPPTIGILLLTLVYLCFCYSIMI